MRDPSLLECFGSLFGSHELTKDALTSTSKKQKKRSSKRRARAGSTAGLVERAAAIQQEALAHIHELRTDAERNRQRLRESMLETNAQLHGLGIMRRGSALRMNRRRSASGTPPPPASDARPSRRTSLPERMVATAALRAAQLASLDKSTRQYVQRGMPAVGVR